MPNRLALETSPYLQQHAQNPVDWYPWGEQALTVARIQDKPILLSIGYSACHWCHVMAHESFEDAAVAARMNQLYINIKVDREERPDLDHIYQTAHALLTQRNGGWPLTMFLTPDQTPFFGGTYFPKTARHGMPGFLDLLPQIANAYRERREEIAQHATALHEALARQLMPPAGDAALQFAPLDLALRELKRVYDETDGGLGAQPKFPHPYELEFCLQQAAATRDDYAHGMVKLTLTKMAEGGIYDQLGGGFSRYSVDAQWTIPHFEKMLYDNGPLLRLYSDLWLNGREPLYACVVDATAAWVMREMQAPEGGYYSSLDADSEHEEGKFYVWTPEEVQAALSAAEYAVAIPHYGLDGPPNFEEEYWHLRVRQPLAYVAQRAGLTVDEGQSLLDSARGKLFAMRSRRIAPGRDEKILTSWNALMIKGMAHAARIYGRPEWLASARAATAFIRAKLRIAADDPASGRKRLLATYKDGTAHLNAYLDDYAFLLDALLELLQTDFRLEDLIWARELADVLLEQFEDRELGGFYFVSHDHERLIERSKTGHDNATPSGNGIAACALQRLGHILCEPRYLEAAQRTLAAFMPLLRQQANACTSLCLALAENLTPPDIVVLRGADAARWQHELAVRYLPHALILAIPEAAAGLPAALDKPAQAGAWLCHGSHCLPPIATLQELYDTLDCAVR